MHRLGWKTILRLSSEEGANLIEYSLLVLFFAVACVGFLTTIGQNLAAWYAAVVPLI